MFEFEMKKRIYTLFVIVIVLCTVCPTDAEVGAFKTEEEINSFFIFFMRYAEARDTVTNSNTISGIQIGILLNRAFNISCSDKRIALRDRETFEIKKKIIWDQLAAYSYNGGNIEQAQKGIAAADAILQMIASNPNQDKKILEILSKDTNKNIRQAALKTLHEHF